MCFLLITGLTPADHNFQKSYGPHQIFPTIRKGCMLFKELYRHTRMLPKHALIPLFSQRQNHTLSRQCICRFQNYHQWESYRTPSPPLYSVKNTPLVPESPISAAAENFHNFHLKLNHTNPTSIRKPLFLHARQTEHSCIEPHFPVQSGTLTRFLG